MDSDLIASFYHMPPEWIPMMKRIVFAVEYVRAATWGDVPMDDEDASEEEEEEEVEDGSKEETKLEEKDDEFSSD